MSAYIHPKALCETQQVGDGTRIWAFAHVLPGAKIGRDCNICDGVFVEQNVVVGDRVTLKCGVQLWDGVVLEDDVFIGPNATFTNNPFPRSRQYPETNLKTVVQKGASIGANATLLPGITIGSGAMVGAGAVVVRSVPPNAIVVGNPARIVGYTDTVQAQPVRLDEATSEFRPSAVAGVALHRFRQAIDMRGSLAACEFGSGLPFLPKRCFLVHQVPSREVRGEHAHRNCHQFLVATHGALSVVVDDGHSREEYRLDNPGMGLHLPPMVWGTQYKYTEDAVLLVLASELYDPADYIRDYTEFLDLVKARD